jgi:hypothetical protein
MAATTVRILVPLSLVVLIAGCGFATTGHSAYEGLAPSGNMRFRACIAFLSRRNPHAFVVGGSSDGIQRMQPPQNHVPTEPYGLGLIIE